MYINIINILLDIFQHKVVNTGSFHPAALHYSHNKATRSPEISRLQVQKLTPPPLSTPPPPRLHSPEFLFSKKFFF